MNKANLKTRLGDKVQNLNAESTPAETERQPESALVTIDSNYTVLNTNVLDIISENLKDKPLSRHSIDVIKAPAGGALVFTIPSLSGEDIQKELTGIILDYATPRAYWETADPVEGTPPTCYSPNSLTSHDGKPCSRCMFNEFGSKDGESNAKACKESVELFLLRENNIMPIIVRVPVSSKTTFQKYVTRLVSGMVPLCGVVTKITLEKAVSRTGQAYAKFIFEALNTLTSEETNGFRAFGKKIMEVLKADDEPDLKEVS